MSGKGGGEKGRFEKIKQNFDRFKENDLFLEKRKRHGWGGGVNVNPLIPPGCAPVRPERKVDKIRAEESEDPSGGEHGATKTKVKTAPASEQPRCESRS